MASYGSRLVVPIDMRKKPEEQKLPLHNRWHLDIPPVIEVRTGEVFSVEMMDCIGGGITNEYTAEDIKHADASVGNSYHVWLQAPTPRTVIPVDPKKRTWDKTLILSQPLASRDASSSGWCSFLARGIFTFLTFFSHTKP